MMVRRNQAVSAAFLLLLGLGLSGCAAGTAYMMDAQEPAFVSAPPADRSTVIFLRPSNFGFAISAVVYDADSQPPSLVGIVGAGKKVAIAVPPGQRRFMVVSEAADFMDAELLPGKTYYALVTPRMGMWRARFSLRPMNHADPDLVGYLNETGWVENTAASHDWSRANMDSVRTKQAEYIQDWLSKPDRPALRISDGR